ncbi:preprotein translocase subunit SecE [Fructilactobacillus vespulae]|uniref:preprotein translocase subunit SecE n=1 Tax=Fructilactobacillus vespulae TaxID=1249630 RepID=UPI0039B6E921
MRLWKFLKSVVTEMKIVVWPSAKQNRTDTITVFGTAIFFTIFLGAVDWIVQFLLMKL